VSGCREGQGLTGAARLKPLPQGIRHLHGDRDGPRSSWDVSPEAGQGGRPASYSATGAETDGPRRDSNGVAGHREMI